MQEWFCEGQNNRNWIDFMGNFHPAVTATSSRRIQRAIWDRVEKHQVSRHRPLSVSTPHQLTLAEDK